MSGWKEARLLKKIKKGKHNNHLNLVEFSSEKPTIRSIIFCLPQDFLEFRVARYIFFPLFESYKSLSVRLLCPSGYKHFAPEINPIRLICYNDDDFTADLMPGNRLIQLTGELSRPDAVVDLNITGDIRIQNLILQTEACLRIGFHGENSHLFYNVEIEVQENSSIESAYHNIRKILNL